jgi:hypothetical protein
MKKRNAIGIITAMALCAIVTLAFISCDEDDGKDTPHTHDYSAAWSKDATQHWHECSCGNKKDVVAHQWQWEVTTPATAGADGLETETCATCGATNVTRTISKTLAFTSVTDLGSWLTSQPSTTPEKPYTVALNVDDISTIGTTLSSKFNKYIYLDLSSSTFASIGESVFVYCLNLTGITIPDSVTTIGESAFVYCSNLTGITIPDSVTTIGDNAFSGCTSLASVTIGNSVTTIGDNAFRQTNLTSVTIPDSVTSIGHSTFSNCASLMSATIGNSLETTPYNIGTMFSGCTSLTEIHVAVGNNAYISDNGVLYDKSKTTLIKYPIGKTGDITIPNSVTTIEWLAFEDCTNLTSITIPNGVTDIVDRAFLDCTNLTSITIPASVTSITFTAFTGCGSLTEINVDTNNNTYTSEQGVLYSKDKTRLIICLEGKTGFFTIPNSVTGIGSSAFNNCTSLTSVTIPNSVTSIGVRAFSNCTSLASVTFEIGSNIADANFEIYAFPEGSYGSGGDTLKTAYSTGKAGTYTRDANGNTWSKQP